MSDREGHEVSPLEQQCQDGAEPELLDVIDVPLIGHQPFGVHQENWLLDKTARWRKVGRMDWNSALALSASPDELWVNGRNTTAGVNDAIPATLQSGLSDSLVLIHVNQVLIEVSPAPPQASNPHPVVRGRFRHKRCEYLLRVTDPVQERRFQAAGIGKYPLGESLLTISLTEEFTERFFKLIAAIIERATFQPRTRP